MRVWMDYTSLVPALLKPVYFIFAWSIIAGMSFFILLYVHSFICINILSYKCNTVFCLSSWFFRHLCDAVPSSTFSENKFWSFDVGLMLTHVVLWSYWYGNAGSLEGKLLTSKALLVGVAPSLPRANPHRISWSNIFVPYGRHLSSWSPLFTFVLIIIYELFLKSLQQSTSSDPRVGVSSVISALQIRYRIRGINVCIN